MSFFDTLLGYDAADAANSAASDTYTKQQAAVKGITDYGDQYAKTYQDAYSPYMQTGQTANTALQNLMVDPSSVRSLPGNQFAQGEGIKALENSAAAKGMLNSGQAGKDVLKYATGYADQTYGDQYNRLMQGGQYGQNATAGAMQGMQGQLATRQSAYQGNMGSAGTIGQGNIAAANAESQGLTNTLTLGAKLAGTVIGGF